MPSTGPSLAFSVASLSLIYYCLGDIAFFLVWAALSYELITQFLFITASVFTSNKRAIKAEQDAIAEAITASVAGQLEAKTDAEIRRLNIARAESEQQRKQNVDAIANQIIEGIIAVQMKEREEQDCRKVEEQLAHERQAQEDLERVEREAREAREADIASAIAEAEASEEAQQKAEEKQRDAEPKARGALEEAIPDYFHRLDPNSSDFTCIGTTKKGYRCGQWMLSDASLSQGARQLRDMRSQNPSTLFEMDKLRKLAHNLLCPRWHQGGQDAQIANRWYGQLALARTALDKLEDVKAEKVKLRQSRERMELDRQNDERLPLAYRFREVLDSEYSQTLSRPSTPGIPSLAPSVSAMSTPERSLEDVSRSRSSSINSDETPSQGGDDHEDKE